jgi:hypothetical protein
MVLVVLVSAVRAAEPALAPPPVKLAVIISVDQLRADYLVRFRPYFAEGGFKRLLEGGADFRNNHYRHALTITAPGHATISTGVHANIHGIQANEWLNRATWEFMSNVEDVDSPLVGLDAQSPRELRLPKAGRSPRNLQAPTVGDQLKLRFGPNSKVFAASNKDRSAMLLAGKLADGAYWDEFGRMVTSRYYREALPAWIEAFNAERLVHKAHGRTWERLLDPKIYDLVQGPDNAAGELSGGGYTRTFPKRVTGGSDRLDENFFAAYDNSPFAIEFLGEFAQRAIKEEQLGRHPATDMLCVSFSQIDSVGHSFGPDSHEVMDSVLRLDRVLASLLDTIDREVGLANCVIVLSADHGVPPLPERVQALRPGGIPSGRIVSGLMDAPARKALTDAFGALPGDEYWFTRNNYGYHVRPSALAAKKLKQDDVARVLKASILQHPFIAAAYTREELLAEEPQGDSQLAMLRRSYYAPSDRDVVYVLKPYFMDKADYGTTHGSPYDYDTHVPQLWFGRGVPRGEIHNERVGVDDIAPTMASLLGIPAPPQAQGRRLF